MIPGEYHVASGPIDYNGGYEAISLEVKNVGDRAAQVGSHYHFYEANEAGLQFDREKGTRQTSRHSSRYSHSFRTR